MAAEANQGEREQAWVAEAGGMTLYGTIGHEAVLRPDGSVWLYHDQHGEREEWVWEQATPLERIAAFVIARRRIPELARLIPGRTEDAPTCKRCGGSGEFVSGVICPECGGLGWLHTAAT